MHSRTIRLLKNPLAAMALLGAAHAASAHDFQSGPITIVVGYTAGGQADAIARAVGEKLGERLKTPVVVENRPGANAQIAAQLVARAESDGHTLLLVTDAMTTIDPQLPGPKKLDPAQAFTPIIDMATAPLFLAANNGVPASSLEELIALGKEDPERLNFGTSGNATPHRIAGEMLQQRGGFTMTHIPYKGTSAAVTDLAGGHIELVIGASLTLKPLADAGKIKLLAVTSEQRFPLLPEVPAVSETFAGFDIVTYLGLMAPKETPAEVIETLNGEINQILAEPGLRQDLEQQGMLAVGGTPAAFEAQIAADYQARGEVIRELKITAE
jgi:tripartite-type tricarboxylate transporter receptor subunit TctC